jgi:uncharacterized membrane protein YcaP (DUF421 family)
MDPKPGVATSEFYVSLAVIVLGAILSSGLFTPESTVSQVIGAILAAAGALGYTVSRAMVKSAAKKAEGPPVMKAPLE